MQDETPLALQEMINRGTDWLDLYLRQFEEGKSLPRNSMLGIYEGAVGWALRENSIEWAEIAVRAAELMAIEGDGEYRDFGLLRAMQCRAHFISRMGSRPGHPVLGTERILRWFTAELEFQIDAVKEKAARWRNHQSAADGGITLSELKILRNIRGRASVLRTLAECGEVPDDPGFTGWVEMERLNLIP